METDGDGAFRLKKNKDKEERSKGLKRKENDSSSVSLLPSSLFFGSAAFLDTQRVVAHAVFKICPAIARDFICFHLGNSKLHGS